MLLLLDASITGGGPRHVSGALDVEVTIKATATDIAAAWARRSGRAVDALWVGGVKLAPDHLAGAWPLLHGAVLTAGPAPWPVAPRGAHAAVTSGPDAGWAVPLEWGAVLGRDPARVGAAPEALVLALSDTALDPAHLELSVGRAGIAWRDLDTANGTRRRHKPGKPSAARRRGAVVRDETALEVGHSTVALRWSGSPPQRGPREGSLSGRLYLPDPTRPGAADTRWHGSVALHGPTALATARAVVLARGTRPPASLVPGGGTCASVALAGEHWLAWLPSAADLDGPIVVAAPRGARADIEVECLPRETIVRWEGYTWRDRALGVGAVAAELAARAIASHQPAPLPSSLSWADLDAVPPGAVAWGASEDLRPVVWRPWGDGGHALVAGVDGAGATTAVITACAGLALGSPPHELEVVVIAPGHARPWAECIPLPHVVAAAVSASEADALAALSSPIRAPKRLVIVDGLHRFGGATVARAVENAMAASTPTVRYLVSTARLAGIVSPGLLARVGTVVALRMATAQASVDVVGVPDAAGIPADAHGNAIVRHRGGHVAARIATPSADPTPLVQFADASPRPCRGLTEAVWAAHPRA